jgi:hypothetical protein
MTEFDKAHMEKEQELAAAVFAAFKAYQQWSDQDAITAALVCRLAGMHDAYIGEQAAKWFKETVQ